MSDKPNIRIIHHMARSGGTVICKCIATMHGVCLLSEIHPLGPAVGPTFNPLTQAHQWYALLTPDDIKMLQEKQGGIQFADAISLVENRCRENNQILVIRDWTHMDFTGVPFVKPSYRLLTAEALADRFNILSVSSTRHPVTQWLSLNKLAIIKGKLSLEQYLTGYLNFAKAAVETGFQRYEDFVADPNSELKKICSVLDIKFDPEYENRWWKYENITGDNSRKEEQVISPRKAKKISSDILAPFRADDNYWSALELLGYEDLPD